MDHLYPPGPAGVPAGFAAPSPQYKRHAWLAMAALLGFVVLYLALAGWFAFKAWSLFEGALSGSRESFLGFLFGLPAAFLAVFMLKALFFVKHGGGASDDLEVTREQEPRLFAFLERLADEAGAPRPHRVFLSPRVNAAVFYDLSVLNLIFPSRKNLEIGLGLVNVLSLSELKAVLAHEFGHFAQRSMAVGRWVYVAQQIADHIVSKRDALDRFLQGLSHVDLRIAWVGWLLRLVVWSIRSLLEQLFRLVVMAQRALSREMEMQADLVAVSLTGSDALIHALHLAQAADDAWDRTIGFANAELGRGHLVADLFTVQTRMIERLREMLDEPGFGRAPAVPGDAAAAAHRVFRAEIAQPPRMWLTHPLNHEREENAKRTYLRTPPDERSAWSIFTDGAALRLAVSARIAPQTEAQARPIEETIAELDRVFAAASLDRRYRGVYLGRSPVRWAVPLAQMHDPSAHGDVAALDALYPPTIVDELDHLRGLRKELGLLESVRDGFLTPPGGVIRFRDATLKRNELPGALATLRAEVDAVEARVNAHDRACRSVHQAAAARLGCGWDAYLASLAAALHYAEHSLANLHDADRFFSNEYRIVTADGKVSNKERARLVKAARELFTPLQQIYEQRFDVDPGAESLARLGKASYAELLEEFKLNPPTDENLGDWLGVLGGWLNLASGALAELRDAALETLLRAEAKVAGWTRDGLASAPENAPAPGRMPATYPELAPGKERKLQTRLDWWDRFQTADGFWPALARLSVAGAIVAAVVGFGGFVGEATLDVYNGLGTRVSVQAGEQRVDLAPFTSARLEIVPAPMHVRAVAANGKLVEEFDVPAPAAFGSYVYNVANAAPLIEWTASYGNAPERANRQLGAPRWVATGADHVFSPPPRTVSTKGGGATRDVLDGLGGAPPDVSLSLVTDPTQAAQMLRAHAAWDAPDSRQLIGWLEVATKDAAFAEMLAARLRNYPNDVAALRAEQDAARPDRAAVCARQRAQAEAAPTDSGLHYLAVRCLDDGPVQNAAFLEGLARFPQDPWLAFAGGYVHAQHARWDEATSAFETALRGAPALGEGVAVELARFARIAQSGDTAPAPRLLQASKSLERYTELAKRVDYVELHQGRLVEALRASEASNTSDKPRIVRLAAASEGASPELVRDALALPLDQGFDAGVLGAALGLALREHVDPAPLLARVDETLYAEDAASLRRFVAQIQEGAMQEGALDPGAADLEPMSPSVRGQAYVIGIVALGERAPRSWRRDARALLFEVERPYFAE